MQAEPLEVAVTQAGRHLVRARRRKYNSCSRRKEEEEEAAAASGKERMLVGSGEGRSRQQVMVAGC